MDTLFTLSPLPGIVITAFDAGCDSRGGVKYRATVTLDGVEVFPIDGPIYGAFSPLWPCDDVQAQAHVLSHVGMKPGDTDTDFFEGYTDTQLAFAETYGESLALEAMILEEGDDE